MIFVALTSTGIIKSVFVQLDSEITEDAIYCLAKAAERRLSGVALCDITPPLIQTMAAEMLEYSLLFSPFFTALYDTAQKLLTPEVLIKGENNLFNLGTSALNAAKALGFLRSDSFTDTLTQQTDKVSILIPEGENFTATALIYSGYKFSDDLFGSIGILGPYRLDYAAVIPMIEYFSSSLENMIKNSRIDK